MFGKNEIRKSITVLTAIAVWCVYSMVAFAAAPDVSGVISVTGQVTVNGQTAVTNSTIVSGSTIVTGANSSAAINLGKNGRIELAADSNITLKFADNSIVGILSSGKARVSNASGVATTITTKDSAIIADAGQANSFAVEVECSHTHVDTMSGLVTMRSGTNDKQVAAGTDATTGNVSQTGCAPCLRPNSAPPVATLGLGALPIALILLAAAGAVGTAIIIGNNNETTITPVTPVIVSTTR
ncbi:MAG: hypothetical protein JWN60_2498 [Acidobacteria bacterium]|jgi:hypothetical protein|nr:hypothetical protein [Acidobacteriota bacterium]